MAEGDRDRELNRDDKSTDSNPANRDPLSGAPGAHPIGAGAGAAAAGAAGAAVGAIGGPVGAVIGAVVGGLAGGLAGKGVAEMVNPTEEDAYWRDNYSSRPYADKEQSYDEYQPAYRTGYEGFGKHGDSGRSYDELETDLAADYETNRGSSSLDWERARPASRDAYERLARARREQALRENTQA